MSERIGLQAESSVRDTEDRAELSLDPASERVDVQSSVRIDVVPEPEQRDALHRWKPNCA